MIKELTQENFDSTIEANEVTIIDFWADWCAPCHGFREVFSKVASTFSGVCFCEVDTEKEKALANDFAVRSVPTVVILRRNVVVFAESGTMPAEALSDLVERAQQLKMDDVHKNIASTLIQ